MSAAPGPYQQATQALIDAAKRLAAARPNRHRPSPSSIEASFRASWFSEKGVPPDNPNLPDAESYISAESGRLTESLLIDVVNESGLARLDPLTEEERELLPVQYRKLHLRGGQFDQVGHLMSGKTETDVVLVEFKRKSVYSFLEVARKGVREGAPSDYQQVQVLMHCLGLKRTLYFAANWDRGALTTACRGKERIPGIYGEWVSYSHVAALMAGKRAALQEQYILHEKDPARVPCECGDPADSWKARWCPWLNACRRADGKALYRGKL